MDETLGLGGRFLDRLFWVNVWLAGFNLLPAFPMDGGRVLRALLALRMDYLRATHVAASLGQFMALVFGFLGFFYNPLLIFIALFVWLGAAQEASMVQMRAAMSGIPIERVMITDFVALQPHDTLSRAAKHVLAGFQQDFPVVEEDGRLVGILTRNDLVTGLARYGAEGRVGDVMHREFVTADPRDMLQTAFARLQEHGWHTLPVVQDGRLVGVVTAENLAEVLMLHEALREAGRLPRAEAPAQGPTRSGPHRNLGDATYGAGAHDPALGNGAKKLL
jgi:CBS domain-containing protein